MIPQEQSIPDVAHEFPANSYDSEVAEASIAFAAGEQQEAREPLRRGRLARMLDLDLLTTKAITDELRESHPHLFTESDGVVLCQPPIISMVRNRAAEQQATKLATEQPTEPSETSDTDRRPLSLTRTPTAEETRERQIRAELHKRFKGFAKEMSDGETLEAAKFKTLINLFGVESASDLLYAYRPEFKDKKFLMPHVKSFLGDYLGEVTVKPSDVDLTHLQEAVPLLSNANLQRALTEVIKRHCLSQYQAVIKKNPHQDEFDIFAQYLDSLSEEINKLNSPELTKIIENVVNYHLDLFEIKKPDKFVERVSEERLFPDITQRITIKELREKRRWLNGNGTGMGKSASAIMSKEILGSKCAVILAPSAVLDRGSWQEYLSAHDEKTGRGYFKPGQEPRVLVVKNMESLQRSSAKDYDYILISHERINEAYTQALLSIDYDFLVIDEAHNFKNILEGVRPDLVQQLADKIDGPSKHLLLMTASAAPNKVKDIAMILRLQHPKRFKDVTNEQLVHQIINGDLLDIRSLLLERMQNQRLEDFIDIEPPNEAVEWLEMTDEQKVAYDVLLEEYELTPSEKMMALRLFCLNPSIFDATPDLGDGKVGAFRDRLTQLFARNDKVLAFINDYVNDVLVGDKAIFGQIEMPEGVELGIIHGKTDRGIRNRLSEHFQTEAGKMLLAVSGQTVSVGVDLASADALIGYNLPWTWQQWRQQIGRAQRPGRVGTLDVLSFVTRGTIEEGIYKYILVKNRAIEKLIYGIPLNEAESQVVRASENGDDAHGVLAANGELADTYRSPIDRMNRLFSVVKNIGEVGLLGEQGFLAKHGVEYADNYQELTDRSYQANVARLNSTLISRIVAAHSTATSRKPVIIDIGSGPEMLRRHIDEPLADYVISVDINSHQLREGFGKRTVGTMAHLPFGDKTVDIANMALTYHYSGWSNRYADYERIQVLGELNRVLRPGGSALITMPYSLDYRNEGSFFSALHKLGFTVLEDYTGEATNGENFRARTVAIRKDHDVPHDPLALLKQLGSGAFEALRIVKNDTTGLRDSRHVMHQFELNGGLVPIRLNSSDQRIYAEERAAILDMEELRRTHGSIADIPAATIVHQGLARLYANKRYILFKKLDRGSGAVVVRDKA